MDFSHYSAEPVSVAENLTNTFDVATGEEVSIVGPASASQADLEKTAVAKLRYVLNKKATTDKGPGIIA